MQPQDLSPGLLSQPPNCSLAYLSEPLKSTLPTAARVAFSNTGHVMPFLWGLPIALRVRAKAPLEESSTLYDPSLFPHTLAHSSPAALTSLLSPACGSPLLGTSGPLHWLIPCLHMAHSLPLHFRSLLKCLFGEAFPDRCIKSASLPPHTPPPPSLLSCSPKHIAHLTFLRLYLFILCILCLLHWNGLSIRTGTGSVLVSAASPVPST